MKNQFRVSGAFFSISFLVFIGLILGKQNVSLVDSTTANQTQFTETTINDNSNNTSNTWAINGPIRVKGNERLGLAVQSQNLKSNTPIILHEGLNEWIMLSNGAIVLKNNQKLGLTVQNQNIANGSKIILHEGYNLWKVLSNGAIVLKDKPTFGLMVLNQNLNNNAQIILHGGYNTWTGQVTTTATPPGAITYGSKITLLSYHNKYLVAEDDGTLNANRAAAGAWENFIILNAANSADRSVVKFGDRINLKTAHNKFAVAESDGKANANRAAAGPWEAFIILNQANQGSRNVINVVSDKICFKTAHNKFLVAETDGNANANRDAASTFETWRINAKAAVISPTIDNTKKWMGAIKDNVSLAGLSIPGTHNSGAKYGCPTFAYDKYAKCQSVTITEQLNAGIRYLDIRCRRSGTVFTIHHGKCYQQLNFGQVINECQNFLNENPTETILMRIKEEHDASENSQAFPTIFNTYQSKSPSLWYTTNRTIPTMGQARGKIVILDNASLGNGVPYGSQDIQDEYYFDETYKKMKPVQDQLLKARSSTSNEKFFINHTSATGLVDFEWDPVKIAKLGLSFFEAYPTPKDFADFGEPHFRTFFKMKEYTTGRYGIIPMDFPKSDIINYIIQSNAASLRK